MIIFQLFRKPDDGLKGCSYFVTHVCQETLLDFAQFLRFFLCFFHLNFVVVASGNINPDQVDKQSSPEKKNEK